MVISIWKYRRFILRNSLRDIWYRYAGSSIGFLWNVVNPLFQILLFTLVFSKIMVVRLPGLQDGTGFAIYLCAGLVPWLSFSETVTRCANSFLENSHYLKKLAIPEQVFVAQNAVSGFFSLSISMVLLVIICFLLGHYPSLQWFALPVILILLQAFGFGLGLFFGVLNVFFRDIGQGLGLIMQLWFWATPIVYLEDILPLALRKLLVLNPIYWYINSLQKIIVRKELPSVEAAMLMVILSVLLPVVGYLLLRKLRPEIRDVL